MTPPGPGPPGKPASLTRPNFHYFHAYDVRIVTKLTCSKINMIRDMLLATKEKHVSTTDSIESHQTLHMLGTKTKNRSTDPS
jgi:hypothetical protein